LLHASAALIREASLRAGLTQTGLARRTGRDRSGSRSPPAKNTCRPAGLLVATKIDAYHGRGNSDMLRSVAFEDIMRLVDGREELVAEIAEASPEMGALIVESLTELSEQPFFETAVAGVTLPDMASQGRLPLVLQRIEQIHAS
jgi:hypothetical protein